MSASNSMSASDPITAHGRDVALTDVAMVFDGFTAVHPTSLTVRAGEFFSILGPSGCGKTTLLRIVSGFQPQTGGTVAIGGDPVDHLPANRRPTAMIFQNLALFPLMTVWENVAFGLEARGMAKRRRRTRAEELLALVALEGQADKTPAQLSGGQRQRVAVARALAVEPAVLCLDEPLSALDLKLRQHMRAELRAIQKRTGVTFIYITHDQGEALAMSDRVAVMNAGRIEQVGTPAEIYDAPHTPFVASFVGEQNVFAGRVVSVSDGMASVESAGGHLRGRNVQNLAPGDEAILLVRPQRTGFVNGGPAPANVVEGRVTRTELEGPFVNILAELAIEPASRPIALHLTNDGRFSAPDGVVRIGFSPDDALVMRDEGGLAQRASALD